MKKLLALIAAAAQVVTLSAGLLSAPAYAEEPSDTVVSYSVDTMTKADGETVYPVNTQLDAADYNRYGITADTAGVIWGVQRISPVNNVGVEGLRFATRSPETKTNSTIMDWDFASDTVNTPAAMDQDGYIYESEFMVQVKENSTYAVLNFNGKNEEGEDVKIGEIRFAPNGNIVEGAPNPGSAYAVNSSGTAIGNKRAVKVTSDTDDDSAGELLFIRAKIDFVNNKFSAWVVPRKDEAGEYAPVEPTEADLLVENVDMISTDAVQFTGISYDMMSYAYGNAVWINNMSVKEYTPEVIVATPTPSPQPTAGHEEGIALKVAVLSDMQYGRASQQSGVSNLDYAGLKFKEAVRQVLEKAGGIDQLDVLMIPGDITHNSNPDEYQAFVEDLEEVIPSGSHTKVIFLRGNHDAKPDKQSNFVTYLSDYDNTLTSANNVYDIYGYKFVMVSQDTQRGNDESSSYPYIHSPETIEWFTEAVQTASAEAAEEGKPVFVGMHPNAINTVYGSFPVEGMRNGEPYESNYWGTSELYASMENCPNVITFSGHSHWDIANERSIHQKDFTSLNTGAVNNMEIEDCWDESFQPKRFGSNENESSGYYIEVGTDNKVTVHRMDFYREREFGEPWVIDVNDKENWQYTDDRDKNAPYFEEGAAARVENIGETTCRVTFTQAKDDETDVGHYKMELINQETGAADKTFTISSYYWQGDQAPSENYWDVTGLESGTSYKAVITAYDSFYQESSNTIETDVFTTNSRVVKPAELASVSFTADGVQDTSEYARFYGVEPRTYGETPVSYNSDLNMYEAEFEREAGETGSANFFKILFDDERKSLMQGSDGYTIDVMFSPSAINGSDNVIGMAQSSGFDIETTKDGTLEAYVRHNGSWVNDPYPGSSLTVETDQYYHITVTYDGSAVKVYNNGELVDSVPASGAMEFYSEADPNYGMVIGGDYNPTKDGDAFVDQQTAQNAFSGKIVFANIYSGALTGKEVAELNDKYEAKKSLEKADELNTLLSTIEDEDLKAEGYALMADPDLTDDMIAEFIDKAESGKSVSYSFYAKDIDAEYATAIDYGKYGITADVTKDSGATGAIWSVQKINGSATCYTDALRFSTVPNAGDKNLMKLTFANDTVNNPDGVTFENGKYVYESDFQAFYKDSGYMQLSLLGSDAEGAEGVIATVKFEPTTGEYRRTNAAYLVDVEGGKIGNSVLYKGATDDGGDSAAVLRLRVEMDMSTGTYTAYLIQRKTDDSAYEGTEFTEQSLLAADVPFSTSGVCTLDAVSADITGSAGTNIFWINNIEITGVNGDAPEYIDAEITMDKAALLEARKGTVSAEIRNETSEPANMSLYCAQYAEDGTLAGIAKVDKQIAADTADTISADVTLDEACTDIKVFVWDDILNSYAAE